MLKKNGIMLHIVCIMNDITCTIVSIYIKKVKDVVNYRLIPVL